jgi:hypothetical protein
VEDLVPIGRGQLSDIGFDFLGVVVAALLHNLLRIALMGLTLIRTIRNEPTRISCHFQFQELRAQRIFEVRFSAFGYEQFGWFRLLNTVAERMVQIR